MPELTRKLLILGGTGEAVELATQLLEIGKWRITYSLAGATQCPRIPNSNIRIGGFGGVDGLTSYLISSGIDVVLDITHPFATTISKSARQAATKCTITYIRYERPMWTKKPGDQWLIVKNLNQAVSTIPADARVFLTIGTKEYPMFLTRNDVFYFIRVIETPTSAAADNSQVSRTSLQEQSNFRNKKEKIKLIIARPPFSLRQELALMTEFNIQYVVTKNSGGGASYSKLAAARQLGLPVIIVDRPNLAEEDARREQSEDVHCFENIPDIINWISMNC